MSETPGRPDLQYRPEFATLAPKSHAIRNIIIGAVGMFFVLGVIGIATGVNDEPTTAPAISVPDIGAPSTSVDSNLEAARMAWDVQSASAQAAMCDFYNTPPVGITPELVRAFDSGAHLGYNESKRVLGTLLAEEC
jgi:hypothetical protein